MAGRGSYQEKLRPGRGLWGAWARGRTVAPLPSALQWARGRGGGKGTHQYWVHTPPGPRHHSGTRLRPPGGHLCSGEREEGGGKEEDSREGQQAPRPPPELWDRMGKECQGWPESFSPFYNAFRLVKKVFIAFQKI